MITAFLALACGGSSSQQAEANKIVDEANKKLEEARSLMVKTETRNKTLFSANIQTVSQLQAYKNRMSDEAKGIIADYEKVVESLKEISKKYDDVSRMNVSDKYKEYTKIKSEEFARRADAVGVSKGNAQAFADIDDPKTMFSKFEENNDKSTKLFKEADELAAKAKKIEDENKDIFRET
jgi:small-conductance mechanosensitive channel